jgi:hypothetical protein
VFHPTGLGVNLGEFPLGHTHDVLFPVKEDAAAAGGTLIQRNDIFTHGFASIVY